MLDHYLPDLGGQRKSDLLGYGGAYNSFNLNLYAYGHQNPLIHKDPDGNSVFKVMSIAFKVVVKGAKAADVVNGIIDDVKTLTSADSSMTDRGLAAFSLVSGVDAKYVKKALHVVDKANDVKQTAQKAKAAQHAGDNAAAGSSAAKVGEGVGDEAYKKYTPGGNFSKKTKDDIAEQAGHKCEYCGVSTIPARKSEKGVIPPRNEGQTDHIVPKSEGGTNAPSNAAHACRECNRNMSNQPKPSPRE